MCDFQVEKIGGLIFQFLIFNEILLKGLGKAMYYRSKVGNFLILNDSFVKRICFFCNCSLLYKIIFCVNNSGSNEDFSYDGR